MVEDGEPDNAYFRVRAQRQTTTGPEWFSATRRATDGIGGAADRPLALLTGSMALLTSPMAPNSRTVVGSHTRCRFAARLTWGFLSRTSAAADRSVSRELLRIQLDDWTVM